MSAALGAYGLGFSEDALVEQPAIQLFRALGWEVGDAFDPVWGPRGSLERESDHEVVLLARLRPALERLNPGLPADALDAAIEELTRDRSTLADVAANQDVYRLIKDGVKVKVRDERGREEDVTVRVIDWRDPENNDFLMASQVWVHGEMYRRRCDLVGFVNGLPLVLVELKASHTRLQDAYDKNLRDYRDTIAGLFWYNGVVILSNGRESRIGSSTAAFEHFAEWKRVEDEGEVPAGSLATMLQRHLPAGPAARHRRELHGVRGGQGRADQEGRQEPSGAGRQPLDRGGQENPGEPGAARRVLAHPGLGQEPLDAVLRAEGAADAARQLDLRDRDRPGRAGRSDLQDLRRLRCGDREARARRPAARICGSC